MIWSQSVSELVSLGSDLLWYNEKDICSLSLVPRSILELEKEKERDSEIAGAPL